MTYYLTPLRWTVPLCWRLETSVLLFGFWCLWIFFTSRSIKKTSGWSNPKHWMNSTINCIQLHKRSVLEKSLVIPPPQITPDVLQALTECNNLTHYQSIDKVSFDLLTHISPTTLVQFFNQLFKPRTSTGCIYYDINKQPQKFLYYL